MLSKQHHCLFTQQTEQTLNLRKGGPGFPICLVCSLIQMTGIYLCVFFIWPSLPLATVLRGGSVNRAVEKSKACLAQGCIRGQTHL